MSKKKPIMRTPCIDEDGFVSFKERPMTTKEYDDLHETIPDFRPGGLIEGKEHK
jgi:hypothetical protein